MACAVWPFIVLPPPPPRSTIKRAVELGHGTDNCINGVPVALELEFMASASDTAHRVPSLVHGFRLLQCPTCFPSVANGQRELTRFVSI